SGVTENEGILILFQYQGAIETEFNLQRGSFNSANWRRWTLSNYGTWLVRAYYDAGNTLFHPYQSPSLQANTWYYLMFRIGDNGRFYTQIWERNNRTAYIVNVNETPPEDGWNTGTWEFVIKVYRGTLIVDSYEELLFPDGYMPPNSPPTQ